MAATADGQEILQRVVRQGKRVRDMVEQLLQASAFVANRSPVLRAEGGMAAEVVAEVVDDWRLAEPTAGPSSACPTWPRCRRLRAGNRPAAEGVQGPCMPPGTSAGWPGRCWPGCCWPPAPGPPATAAGPPRAAPPPRPRPGRAR